MLRYLALVAAGRTTDEAAASIPAPLRPLVLRAARGAVIASGFETEHGGDEPHVHRLAYLRALGRPAIDPNRIDDVRAQLETSRDRPGEASAGARLLGASVLGLVLLGGAAWGIHHLMQPAPVVREEPSFEPAPDPVPEPPAEHAWTPVFRDALPTYAVALDARSAGSERMPPDDVAGARAALLERAGRDAPAITDALTSLLDASESFSAGGTPYADEAWLARLVGLHDALAAESAPFYVDAQLTALRDRRRVLFSTYDVSERHRFEVEGEATPITALHLRRLDTLNFTQSLLGYTRPEIRYALVLVDRLEDFLVTRQLPSIHAADESVFVRGWQDERDTHWVTEFEVWAHEDLLAEARRALTAASLSADDLGPLAAAVVARRHAIDAISHSLRRRGIELVQPATYAYDVARIEGFRGDENSAELSRVREAQHVLEGASAVAAYDALLAAYAASVEEHEVQHRIDYLADRLVHVPAALAELTGETELEDRVNRRAERSNAELSAYLSQIARSETHARTSLLYVTSFVMDRDSWNRPESYAALVVYEALARAAGLTHGPFVVARRIVRAEIAALYGALRARDDLSAVAAQAWSELYGVPLPAIRRTD